ANDVAILAGAVSTPGAPFGFACTPTSPLNIATADGVNGISTNGGAIDVEAFGVSSQIFVFDTPAPLDVNSNGGDITLVSRGTSPSALEAGAAIESGGGDVVARSDNLDIGGTINSGGGRTTLAPANFGRQTRLGTADSPSGMGLESAEINNVTAA